MSSNGSSQRGSSAINSGSTWTTIGVAVLAVATIVLAVLALVQYSTPAGGAAPAPSPLQSPPSASATPTPTVSDVPPPVARVVPAPTRLIGAVDADLAYRTEVGGCPEPRATSAVSRDGGATWQEMDVSGLTGSSAAIGFGVLDGAFASLVTLSSASCEPQLVRTYVAGTNWEVENSDLPATWYLDPRTPSVVHTPDGDKATPCTAVSLAARGDSAAVLCSDGQIFASADRGATWPLVATIAGASAIAVSADGFDVAVLNQGDCVGVRVVPLTQDLKAGEPGSCLVGSVTESAVALATGADGELWVWAGEVVARSGDRGATWR